MASIESPPSNHGDPLANLTGVSLFRSSLQPPPKPHSNTDEVEHTQNYLESLALRNSNKLLEQAQKIVASGSDVLNPEITSVMVSKNQSEALPGKGIERPRERRREFAHKRASFSLVPETRQQADTACLEMKFDPSKYTEPEEFFAALLKIENAEREIQKQRGGVLVDQYQNNIRTQTRRRREVNLRRPVKYRHLYPSSVPETEAIGSSQEMPLSDGFSPSYASSEKENIPSDNVLQDKYLAASAEDKTQNILDELLSHSGEDLDDNRLLQERLQLKPVSIENLGLPDLQFARRNDMKTTGGNVLKRRSILPDTQNIFKRMSSKKPASHRQKGESSLHNAASPAPSESPLAPISILYRRISHSSLSSDPFSAEHIDQALTSNSPLIQDIVKQSKQVAIEVAQDRVGKPADDSTSCGRVIGDFTSTFNKVLNDDPAGLTVGSSPNGCLADLGDNNGVNDFDETLKGTNGCQTDLGDNNEVNDFDETLKGTNGCQTDLGDNNEVNDFDETLKDANSKRSDASQNDRTKGCTEANKEVASTLPEFSLTEPNVDEVESSQLNPIMCYGRDEADVSTFDNYAMNGVSENLDSNENISKNDAVAGQSNVAQSKSKQDKSKGHAGERRKTKQNSRRQSLAAVGTSWKDGVRRSTRNRTRPLEYWRGERLVYGRVHSTMATVIGVKYVNPSVEVKSYISDDYKDLLEQAALY